MATMYWYGFLKASCGVASFRSMFELLVQLVPLGAQFFGSVLEINKQIVV
jgi:hypothetical protein